MINKKIVGIIVILLVLVILFLQLQKVILIKPKGAITETEPRFVWMGNSEEYNLLVSEERTFENLIIDVTLNEKSFVSDELDLGNYYWKIVYEKNNETFETNPVKFTINSFVAFSIEGSFLKNVGNIGSRLVSTTGFVVLEPNEKTEFKEGDYRLEQK